MPSSTEVSADGPGKGTIAAEAAQRGCVMSEPDHPPPTQKPGYRPPKKVDQVRANAVASETRQGTVQWVTLVVVGSLFTLLGVLIVFNATNIFVGLLGGSILAFGGAFLAGALVVSALRPAR